MGQMFERGDGVKPVDIKLVQSAARISKIVYAMHYVSEFGSVKSIIDQLRLHDENTKE